MKRLDAMTRLGMACVVAALVGAGCSQRSPAPDRVEGSVEQNRQPARQQQPVQQQPRSAVIWVKGLSCPLCVQAIKKELTAVKGVEEIDVDYEHESALVSLSSRKPPSREQLVQAVERSGYVLTKLEMQ